jgi:hypothetical protein
MKTDWIKNFTAKLCKSCTFVFTTAHLLKAVIALRCSCQFAHIHTVLKKNARHTVFTSLHLKLQM